MRIFRALIITTLTLIVLVALIPVFLCVVALAIFTNVLHGDLPKSLFKL